LVDQIEVLSKVTELLADPKYSNTPCALAVVVRSLIETPTHQAESASFCLALAQALWSGPPLTPNPEEALSALETEVVPQPQDVDQKSLKISHPGHMSALMQEPNTTIEPEMAKEEKAITIKNTPTSRDIAGADAGDSADADGDADVGADPKSAEDALESSSDADADAASATDASVTPGDAVSMLGDKAKQANDMFRQLRKVPLLRNLDDPEVRKLLPAFTQMEFKKGDTIIKQGNPIHDNSMFYILESGSVDIVINRTTVATRDGIYFGEKGLLEDEPRSASIIAATDIKCIAITRLHFKGLARLDVRIQAAFDFRIEVMDTHDSELRKKVQIEEEASIARSIALARAPRPKLERNETLKTVIVTGEKLRGTMLKKKRSLLYQAEHFSQLLVFKPENPYRMTWDMYMMVLIMYYAFAVPVRLGFSQDPTYPMLEHFFTICFALDILINFNTALIGQGDLLVFNRGKIARDYLKAWFWIDLVATFPFELVIGGGDSSDSGDSGSSSAGVGKLGRLGKIFRLMRIFKLLRILKLGRILRRFKHTTNVNPNWFLLGRTIAVMAFTLHWTACLYWWITANQPADEYGRAEGSDDELFLPPAFIQEARFTDQYGYAFFWAISVVTGIGWDIVPATGLEVSQRRLTALGAGGSCVANMLDPHNARLSFVWPSTCVDSTYWGTLSSLGSHTITPLSFTPHSFTPLSFTPHSFTPQSFTPHSFTPHSFTGGFLVDHDPAWYRAVHHHSRLSHVNRGQH
jgi:CRP-like cAMP-binding protein